jgi:hypothetical protein
MIDAKEVIGRGRIYRRIFDSQSWKKSHGSWERFCRQELKMSAAMAYVYMDVAEQYTDKMIEKYGLSKLGVLLRIPGDDREYWLRRAEHLSSNQLKKEIGALRADRKQVKRITGRKVTPNGKPRAKTYHEIVLMVAKVDEEIADLCDRRDRLWGSARRALREATGMTIEQWAKSTGQSVATVALSEEPQPTHRLKLEQSRDAMRFQDEPPI